MIGEKFGQDVAEHVRIMTAHKIRRRHNEQTGVTRVQR
jgi:hypothetical protein